jgi:hypothetical protein
MELSEEVKNTFTYSEMPEELPACVLNALKCFGISRLSVSKVEVLEWSMEGE